MMIFCFGIRILTGLQFIENMFKWSWISSLLKQLIKYISSFGINNFLSWSYIESTKLWRIFRDISFQREVSSEILSYQVVCTETVLLRFKRDQMFSIIFKSGFWGGQSKPVTPTSFRNLVIILCGMEHYLVSW